MSTSQMIQFMSEKSCSEAKEFFFNELGLVIVVICRYAVSPLYLSSLADIRFNLPFETWTVLEIGFFETCGSYDPRININAVVLRSDWEFRIVPPIFGNVVSS